VKVFYLVFHLHLWLGGVSHREETSTRHHKDNTKGEESDGTSRRAVDNKRATIATKVEHMTEEADGGDNTQEHHRGNEEKEYNRTRNRDEGGEADGQGGNSKENAKSDDRQRISNTWGKQKAQNQAAPYIEKGTRKAKAERTQKSQQRQPHEATREEAQGKQKSHQEASAAAAAAKAHQLTAATPASEEPDAAGRNREKTVKKRVWKIRTVNRWEKRGSVKS
jgi:hypothetical protein